MRYLILSPSGSPIDERDTLSRAEARIHRTNDCILFIPETDSELEEANRANKGEDIFKSNEECEAMFNG